MKLHKTDLISLTWHKCKPMLIGTRTTKDTADRIINMFLEILKKNIMECNSIDIQKLMSFTPVKRKDTRAYSFKEGKVVDREGKMEVRVELAKEIKEKVRDGDV